MNSEKLDLNFSSPTHYLCDLGQFSSCPGWYSAVFNKILVSFLSLSLSFLPVMHNNIAFFSTWHTDHA